jgi:hypothetical protein
MLMIAPRTVVRATFGIDSVCVRQCRQQTMLPRAGAASLVGRWLTRRTRVRCSRDRELERLAEHWLSEWGYQWGYQSESDRRDSV